MQKVSIIIATYDRQALLMDALDSVFQQTWTNLEIIVVDDGSKDSTLTVLAKITDVRLKIIASQHIGAAAARNLGIAKSTGDYIAFLDSDDTFLPNKIQKCVELFIQNPALILVHSAWVQKSVSKDSTCMRKVSTEGDARSNMLKFESIALPCVMVKGSVLKKVKGFREHLILAEDYDLWCRLAAHGPFGKIDEALTIVNHHAHNLCKPAYLVWSCKLDVITYFFKHMDTIGIRSFKYYLSNLHYLIIYNHLKEGNFWQALKHGVNCTLCYPTNIKDFADRLKHAIKKIDRILFNSYFF